MDKLFIETAQKNSPHSKVIYTNRAELNNERVSHPDEPSFFPLKTYETIFTNIKPGDWLEENSAKARQKYFKPYNKIEGTIPSIGFFTKAKMAPDDIKALQKTARLVHYEYSDETLAVFGGTRETLKYLRDNHPNVSVTGIAVCIIYEVSSDKK